MQLASLARLFNLAAIRPDKSRGPANRRGGTIGMAPGSVNPAGARWGALCGHCIPQRRAQSRPDFDAIRPGEFTDTDRQPRVKDRYFAGPDDAGVVQTAKAQVRDGNIMGPRSQQFSFCWTG